MSKTDLAKKIIDAMSASIGVDGSKFSASTPLQANAAIANAITEYITSKTKVTSAYAGMMPTTPPVADPIISDSHSVVGVCAPPVGVDLNTWCLSLSVNIAAGFMVSVGTAGVAFTCNPFLGAVINANAMATNVRNASDAEDPQLASWEAIAQEIINMVNSGIPVVPIVGANSISGSSGTVTSVTISLE